MASAALSTRVATGRRARTAYTAATHGATPVPENVKGTQIAAWFPRSQESSVEIWRNGRADVQRERQPGLDHGRGNMMLLVGAGVRGGYHGTWPGLGSGNLVEGDLKVTTDDRQVLGEVVDKRFPDTDVTQVFPGLPYNPVNVLT